MNAKIAKIIIIVFGVLTVATLVAIYVVGNVVGGVGTR